MPEGMGEILENTNIGQIAQEITQELDIENMVGDGGIESLLSGDNMMNIFKTINDKIENKVGGDYNAKNNLMGELLDVSKYEIGKLLNFCKECDF